MTTFSDDCISNFQDHIESDWDIHIEFTPKTGGFGTVSVLKKKDSKIIQKDKNGNIIEHKVELCIVKTILKEKFKQIEIEILKTLSNELHSMKYYGIAKDEKNVYIYMEYCENAISLDELISNETKLNEDQILKLLKKIIEALKKLHANNIIHRDIKDHHIFFVLKNDVKKSDSVELIVDNIDIVKFIDFGVSKLITEKDGSKYVTLTGTDAYIAPEVRLRLTDLSGRKCDVYSLGCVLVRMAGGKLLELDSNGGIPNVPSNISNKLKNIIQRCIVADPFARFNSEDLFNFLIENKKEKTPLIFNNFEISNLSTTNFNKNVQLSLPHQPLLEGSIPHGVECLKFVSPFNQEVECQAIPSSVTYLDLGNDFDIVENGTNLPTDTIKTLKCGFNFKKPINSRSLPHTITDLQLHNYNQPINKNSIPSTVSYLTLGNNFTHFQSLTNLPPSIINLELGVNGLADDSCINNDIVSKLNSSISSFIIKQSPIITDQLENLNLNK